VSINATIKHYTLGGNLMRNQIGHYNSHPRFPLTTPLPLPQDLFLLFDAFFDDCKVEDLKSITASYPVSRVLINTNGDQKLEIAVSGYSKEELKIHIEENLITVSGEKKEDEKNEWRRVEGKLRIDEKFKTSYRVSSKLDTSKATAEVKDGVLSIIIPRKESRQLQELTII